MISFHSELFLLHSLKLTYIEIDGAILRKTLNGDSKNCYNQRFIVKINNSDTWQAGVVALGNNKGYITVKNSLLKKLKLRLGDVVDVYLEIDASEFGMPFPEELSELLNQDVEGKNRFEALPMGKKRYILYYINQVKSPEKKLERANLLISNLKLAPIGKEEFRFLLGKD